MPHDARINAPANPIPYSCQNRRFQTDIRRGYPHAPSGTLGSAVPEPLVRSEGYTLWLEHVNERADENADWYWLMWYDPEGLPTIPLSGVFDRQQLAGMVEQLLSLVPANVSRR